MKDKFGNYVFQKLFEKGLPQHKLALLETVKGSIVDLSSHAYGCRVIQKAIEAIHELGTSVEDFLQEVEPYALQLTENVNGNHVIQKCFEIFPQESLEKIVIIICNNVKIY